MEVVRGLLGRHSEDDKYCTPDEIKQSIALTMAKRSECMEKLYEKLGREKGLSQRNTCVVVGRGENFK